MSIELTQTEAAWLREILDNYMRDLRMEIADTDRKDFRDGLKETEFFLKDLIERLDGRNE